MYKYRMVSYDREGHEISIDLYHEKLFTKDEVIEMSAKLIIKIFERVGYGTRILSLIYDEWTDGLIEEYGFIFPKEEQPNMYFEVEDVDLYNSGPTYSSPTTDSLIAKIKELKDNV